tara:strand:+ start:710 stop:943 length:234 start_codon:yes stop_codon:yes gene_type:complete
MSLRKSVASVGIVKYGRKIKMNDIEKYQWNIISKSLSVLLSNYDDYDLEQLMYTPEELEAEIFSLQKKIAISLKQQV